MATTKKPTSTAEAAELTRQAHADALAEMKTVKADYAAAAEAFRVAKAQLAMGASTITADEYRQLSGDVEFLSLRKAGAEAALKATGRALRTAVPDLAQALAPVLADVLKVDVIACTSIPTGTSETFPTALLVQTRPSRSDLASGTLSGDLEAIYLRSTHHKPLDADKIENELDQRGVRLTVHPGSSSADRDVLRMTVRSAWPEVPEIMASASANLNFFQQAWKGFLSAAVASSAREVGKISDTTDEAGTRLQVLAVELTSTNIRHSIPLDPREHIELILREIEKREGYWCYPGAGRLISAEIVGNEPAGIASGKAYGGAVKVRMAFQSRVAGE